MSGIGGGPEVTAPGQTDAIDPEQALSFSAHSFTVAWVQGNASIPLDRTAAAASGADRDLTKAPAASGSFEPV